MGCKCDSKPEELELDNLENKTKEEFQTINKESKTENSLSYRKSSDINNHLLKKDEIYQTLSDKYETIYTKNRLI